MFRDFSNFSRPAVFKNSSWSQIIFYNSKVESDQHEDCKIAKKAYPLLMELNITQCLIKSIMLPYLTCNNNSNDLQFADKTSNAEKSVALFSIFQTGTVFNQAEPSTCPLSRQTL